MKSIIDDFKNGTARERLSITSDLFSIIGVSFVAIFAPLFASKAKLNVGEIAGISMITLLSFAGFSLALAFVLTHGLVTT